MLKARRLTNRKGEAIKSLRPRRRASESQTYWSFFGRRISFSTLIRIPGGITSFSV